MPPQWREWELAVRKAERRWVKAPSRAAETTTLAKVSPVFRAPPNDRSATNQLTPHKHSCIIILRERKKSSPLRLHSVRLSN